MKTKQAILLVAFTLCVLQLSAANVWYVRFATGNDTAGDGSLVNPWKTLNGAYAKTVVLSGDTLNVSGTFTSDCNIIFSKSIVIHGTDKINTVFDGDGLNSCFGKITSANSGKTVSIENVTIKNYNAYVSSAISQGGVIAIIGTGSTVALRNCIFKNNAATQGGAIHLANTSTNTASSLTIQDCHFDSNSGRATTSGTIYAGQGGAININANAYTFIIQIDRCLFENNSADTGSGSAISYVCTTGSTSNTNLTVQNSTFYGNQLLATSGTTNRGCIYLQPATSYGSAKLINNTIAYNTSSNSTQFAGVFVNNNNVTLINNILFGNTYRSIANATSIVLAESRNNITDVSSSIYNWTTQTSNGSSMASGNLSGVVNGSSENQLGLADNLSNNGGATNTLAVTSNSVVKNAGFTTNSPSVDQRNIIRDQTPDVGALEYVVPNIWYVRFATGDDINGNGTLANPWKTLSGAYAKNSVLSGDILNVSGTFTSDHNILFSKSIVIHGTDKSNAIFDGLNLNTSFGKIPSAYSGKITIENVTIKNYNAYSPSSISYGGVINIQGTGSTVLLKNSNFQNNTATYGGAVYLANTLTNKVSTLTIQDCYFNGNAAKATTSGTIYNGQGGAININANAYTFTVNIDRCLFEGNSADTGFGSAISYICTTGSTSTSNITIQNSTFFGNKLTATTGISNRACIYLQPATLYGYAKLINNTIAFNTSSNSTQFAGVFVNNSNVTLINNILFGNTYLSIANASSILLAESRNNITDANTVGTPSYNWSAKTVSTMSSGNTNSTVNGEGNGLLGIEESLCDNGGATKTLALKNISNSAAINTGYVTGIPSVDQRSISRDGTPDVGAYEYYTNIGVYSPEITYKTLAAPEGLYRHVPSIAVTFNNALFGAYLRNQQSADESKRGQTAVFIRSSDKGDTWTPPVSELLLSEYSENPLDTTGIPVQGEIHIAFIGNKEYACIVHRGMPLGQNSTFFCSKENGKKWMNRRLLFTTNNNTPVLSAQVVGKIPPANYKATCSIDGVEYDVILFKPIEDNQSRVLIPAVFLTAYGVKHRVGVFSVTDSFVVLEGSIPLGNAPEGSLWEPTLWQAKDGTYYIQCRSNTAIGAPSFDNHLLTTSIDGNNWAPFDYLLEDIHVNRHWRKKVCDDLWMGIGTAHGFLRHALAAWLSVDGINWVHGPTIGNEDVSNDFSQNSDIAFDETNAYVLYSETIDKATYGTVVNGIKFARFALPQTQTCLVSGSKKMYYETVGMVNAPSSTATTLTLPAGSGGSIATPASNWSLNLSLHVSAPPVSGAPYILAAVGDAESGYFTVEYRNVGGNVQLWAGNVYIKDMVNYFNDTTISVSLNYSTNEVSAFGQTKTLGKYARVYLGRYVLSTPAPTGEIIYNIGTSMFVKNNIIDQRVKSNLNFVNLNDNLEVSILRNADGQIIINSNVINNQDGLIKVSNSIGQLLINTRTTGESTVINNSFRSGVYFVTVNVAGETITKKLIFN